MRLNEITKKHVINLPPTYLDITETELIDLIHIEDVSLEEQQRQVANHLRRIKNEFLRGLNLRDNTHQVLIVTPSWHEFENRYNSKLSELDIRVLDYVSGVGNLDFFLKEHCGNVPASKKADAIIADADVTTSDIVTLLVKTSSTGTNLLLYTKDKRTQSENFSLRFPDLADYFNNRIVDGEDFLEKIKTRLNTLSNNYYDQYPEFFAAADRFDKEYPDWHLGEYAMTALSKKPFELDLNKFRTKIDDTVGQYLKDHKVVPPDMDGGAIPDMMIRAEYKPKGKDYKIKQKRIPEKEWNNEIWIRSAYATIRKLGNNGSHKDFKLSETASKAAFTLFTELFVWLDQPHVRERYQTGEKLFYTVPDGGKPSDDQDGGSIRPKKR